MKPMDWRRSSLDIFIFSGIDLFTLLFGQARGGLGVDSAGMSFGIV